VALSLHRSLALSIINEGFKDSGSVRLLLKVVEENQILKNKNTQIISIIE